MRSHLNSTIFQKSYSFIQPDLVLIGHRIISLLSVCAFVRVGDVKEKVLLVMLLKMFNYRLETFSDQRTLFNTRE